MEFTKSYKNISSVPSSIKVGLQFLPDQDCHNMDGTGVLNIQVVQARNIDMLMPFNTAKSKIWVYCALQPNLDTTKKITPAFESSNNPHWEHVFTYPNQKYRNLLENCAAELSVDCNREIIGYACFCSHSSRSDAIRTWNRASRSEILHWEEMLSNPGKIVTKWHQLVKTLDDRHIGHQGTPMWFENPFDDDQVSELLK